MASPNTPRTTGALLGAAEIQLGSLQAPFVGSLSTERVGEPEGSL